MRISAPLVRPVARCFIHRSDTLPRGRRASVLHLNSYTAQRTGADGGSGSSAPRLTASRASRPLSCAVVDPEVLVGEPQDQLLERPAAAPAVMHDRTGGGAVLAQPSLGQGVVHDAGGDVRFLREADEETAEPARHPVRKPLRDHGLNRNAARTRTSSTRCFSDTGAAFNG